MTNPEASLGYLTYLKSKQEVNVDSILELTEQEIGEVAQKCA